MRFKLLGSLDFILDNWVEFAASNTQHNHELNIVWFEVLDCNSIKSKTLELGPIHDIRFKIEVNLSSSQRLDIRHVSLNFKIFST